MTRETADIRERNIIRASAVGIGANVALCGAKAAIGLISNSIAIILDALNNLSDALSSVLVLAGISLANKPANREHPFGFGRFEYLTTLTIALIILGTGVFSLVQSFDKALNPEPSEYGWAGVSVLVLAIGAKLLLSRYYRRQGEANESDTLKVTAGDALFDAVITGATLAAALVNIFFGDVLPWLDGALGTGISAVIIRAGVKMVMSPLDRLLGERMDSGLVETLKKEIAANDKVLGVYDMIIHDYGPGRKLGSVCIGVEDTMTAPDSGTPRHPVHDRHTCDELEGPRHTDNVRQHHGHGARLPWSARGPRTLHRPQGQDHLLRRGGGLQRQGQGSAALEAARGTELQLPRLQDRHNSGLRHLHVLNRGGPATACRRGADSTGG